MTHTWLVVKEYSHDSSSVVVASSVDKTRAELRARKIRATCKSCDVGVISRHDYSGDIP